MSFRRLCKIIARWLVQLCKYIRAYLYVHLTHPELTAQHLWLITEKPTEARDNGYCFFEFLRTRHPEINAYYAISTNSPDKHKVDKLGNVLRYDSLEHYAFYLAADFCISSQTIGAHPADMRPEFHRLIAPLKNKRQKTIFLQHGINPNHVDRRDWAYSSHMLDLFVVSSARERAFIESDYGYPAGYVKELGLCRFDKLLSGKRGQGKTVLIMPTWRKWLHHSGGTAATAEERASFCKSEYYSVYMSLLTGQGLLELLERYGYTVIFYPHYALQCFVEDFHLAGNERVVIADREHYDVQQLLISCDILVTDYSSIFFDFAYLKKPEIFFQFDVERFRSSHYSEGYFSYENDAFGPICHNEGELLRQLEKYMRSCTPEQKYLDRVDSFFAYQDDNNCERTYEAIQALHDANR